MTELISCLCVSKNPYSIVKNSITSFLFQTHPNRELIFVYENDNPYIDEIKNNFNDSSIKFISVEKHEDIHLGELRNISLKYASGKYVIQWDDDDIYYYKRIELQLLFLKEQNCEACILDQRYFFFDNHIYLTNITAFEGSIMAEKSLLVDKYNNVKRGEDSIIILNLIRNKHLRVMHCPYLYLYIYHGNNVFDTQHFTIIQQHSTRLQHLTLTYDNAICALHQFSTNSFCNSNLKLQTIFNNIKNHLPRKHIYTLDIGYKSEHDGLSIVYNTCKNLGTIISNSHNIKNSIVFVCGICDVYSHKLSNNNINIIYTTYEFSPIPAEWTQCLNKYYDIIIVPHEEVKKMFVQSYVKKPIFVVQQGFPKRQLIPYQINKKRFTIGFNGVPVERKNLKLLINVVIELGKTIPNILLKIHISKYYLEMTPLQSINSKHIEISYGTKNDYEMSKWYSSLDCYIFPSSGEGWSFTPRESLSLGIPTIISECPVHNEICQFCETIPIPICSDNIKLSILSLYNNIDFFKKLASYGSKYVHTYNNNKDMYTSLKKILNSY